jgi:predicted ester cyclase
MFRAIDTLKLGDGMIRRKLITNASLLATAALAARQASAASSAGVALIDRLVESINSREFSNFDQIYAAGDGYTNHQLLAGAPSSIPARDAFKTYLSQRIAAFPDLVLSYDVAFASEDMVGVNFIWRGTHKGDYLGVAPTSKAVMWNSTDLFRIRNGVFSDHWGAVDFYGLQSRLRS